ncbi:MAG TPA: Gfo/Idh/MocA family oxidoreductase [Thermoguttaceae bacterium]|nr:Gfo/Idh/MocA family oxidoreductase [Thermoguttaceae bacterium]
MAGRQAITRRRLLERAAAGALVAAPYVVPGAALGADGRTAPNDRIGVGMIGVGRQTVAYNLKAFLNSPDTQVVAVCEVDAWRMENARQTTEKHYGDQKPSGTYQGCRAHGDFREILARDDVDAVMISTPDHWHVPMSLAAVEAGKDVCCEKPITRTIAEGRKLADAVAKAKRVFRVDSEFRSIEVFHRACELVRNGRIGRVQTIRVGVPAGDNVDCPPCPEMPVPEELDYENWQGPAPRAPYTENRVHPPKGYGRPGWMRVLYYCDGMITNWGAHLCDVAQWGNGTDRTGPVEVEGHGVYPPSDSLWNVLKTFEVDYRFAGGVRMIYKTDSPYVRFEGEEGWIQAHFGRGGIQAEPASVLESKIGPDEIRFPLRSEKADFIDCVKTRGRTLEDAEVGHRTTSLCHLGHIAVYLGRKLRWDPDAERFADNDAANELIEKPIHGPA